MSLRFAQVEKWLETFFAGTHLGNTWYVGYLKGIIGTTTKKSSQAKNLPDTEKMGDLCLSSVEYITAKNFEILNPVLIKMIRLAS